MNEPLQQELEAKQAERAQLQREIARKTERVAALDFLIGAIEEKLTEPALPADPPAPAIVPPPAV